MSNPSDAPVGPKGTAVSSGGAGMEYIGRQQKIKKPVKHAAIGTGGKRNYYKKKLKSTDKNCRDEDP